MFHLAQDIYSNSFLEYSFSISSKELRASSREVGSDPMRSDLEKELNKRGGGGEAGCSMLRVEVGPFPAAQEDAQL